MSPIYQFPVVASSFMKRKMHLIESGQLNGKITSLDAAYEFITQKFGIVINVPVYCFDWTS